ncbi:MAG: hypothetical protein H0V76_08780 [Blastocatellia bacterium]|nr:hypothetical protein [Blastocatellia bacterium]
MKLSEEAKAAARELGEAINAAIGADTDVAETIETLRSLGFEPYLTVKLEINAAEEGSEDLEAGEIEFTRDDIRTLERMRIRAE